MNARLRLCLFGLSALVLFGALWLWHGRTAKAAPCDFVTCEWAGWELFLDFPNDQLRVQWVVRAGVYGEGRIGRTVHHKAVYDLSAQCVSAKALPIVDGAAFFDGSNYLRCETPNFLQAVTDLLGGPPHFRFTGDFQPWIVGELTLDSSSETAENHLVTIASHPLYQRPVDFDIAFALPCTKHCTNVAMQMTLCHPVERCTTTGKPLPAPITPESWHTFWFGAGVADFIAFHHANKDRLGEIAAELLNRLGYGHYTPYYTWNFKQAGEIQEYLGFFEVSAPRGIILIGGDPARNRYFRGKVRLLDIDPASFARGAGCC